MPDRSKDIVTAERTGLYDDDLVQHIRENNCSAFERLFDMYYEELVRYAGMRIRSRDVSEGVVQDVFIRIWQQRAAWNPEGSLRAYLYATVRNACISYERKRSRRNRLLRLWDEPGNPEVGADVQYQVEEMNYAAKQAVEALPKRRREIFCLSRQYGLTYKEIAALLGISTKTVEAQMGNALKFLREQLKYFL